MNSKNFCREFEKFFGPYEKRKIKRREILTINKNFLSSLLSTFFCEMSLYLDIPVSRIKFDYGEGCQNLFRLCRNVHRAFVRVFIKSVKKSVVENIKLGNSS